MKMTDVMKPVADIAKFSSASALRAIATEAGADLARGIISGILDGDINRLNSEEAAKKLSAFVLRVCLAMKADGHSYQDIAVFRDTCVQGFRVALSAFRVGLASSTERGIQ